MSRPVRARSQSGAVTALFLLIARTVCADPGSAVAQSDLLRYLADPATFTLIDARSPAEFQASHVDGAINIPHDQPGLAADRLPESPDARLVVYCRTGERARSLRTALLRRGYRNVDVLLPAQLFWSEGFAVFNCSAAAAAKPSMPLATDLGDA